MKNIELREIKPVFREGKAILCRLSSGWSIVFSPKTAFSTEILNSDSISFTNRSVLVSSDRDLIRCVSTVPDIGWDLFDASDGNTEINFPDGNTQFKEFLEADGSITIRKAVNHEDVSLLRNAGGMLVSVPLIDEKRSRSRLSEEELLELGKLVEYQLNLPSFSNGALSSFSKIKLGPKGEVQIIRHLMNGPLTYRQ